ncbi:MAG: hypothetical protein DRI97_05865 [Bacteroidetes bacterium]|nr:MAG: hypothetical protein DRI97_05865 [Bacteroidota bacterium]RLD94440.1 MAG: hypothetical protein DRJ29_05835 [Bacteroidota bacterium]
MKKTSLTILVLSISILTLAQSSGDVENQSLNSGDLENQFYFRFGYSQPTTSYLGVDDNDFWDSFSRVGGVFELGHIFIINKAALSDGLRLGINVDYAEFSYHQLSYSLEDFDIGLLKISSKIGPSLSYSPAEHLVFDVFVKAKIPWVAGIAIISEVDEEYYLAKPGFGVATGINVRYRFLMLGFEYNSDNMKFENQDHPGQYFGNVGDDSDKTPMPSLSFTFGFSF